MAEKGVDDRHSLDVDIHERRIPAEWVRPDVGNWAPIPPPGEIKNAAEESLPPEEAAQYG